jgi:hypothetical protein
MEDLKQKIALGYLIGLPIFLFYIQWFFIKNDLGSSAWHLLLIAIPPAIFFGILKSLSVLRLN